VGGRAARTIRACAISLLASAGLLLATVGNAHAAPSPGQLEAQIDAAWNQVEPLIEQWNAVHDKLQVEQTKVAALKTKIAPLAVRVDMARARVSAVSAQMYMRGPASTFSALLTSGRVSTFVDQLTIMNELAVEETSAVADASALKAQYDAQEAPIDRMVNSLTQQQAALAAKRDAINTQIAQLNKLRLAAYGSSSATGKFRPATCPASYDGSPGARAARWACLQAGKPYQWGSAGPSTFDCSGLTQQAWLHGANVSLPHNAAQQKQVTARVSASNLRIGDLVFYYSDVHHVAIFVGNGWVMSAPSTGDYVRMKPINSSPINSYGRPS
jgi:peptidoglycan DL-endopeptidase CwlO